VVNILNFGDRLAQKDIIDHRSTLCAFIMLLLSLWLALPLSAYAVTASDAPFTNSDDKSHLATYEASSESTLSLPTEAKFLPVHQAFQHLMSFDAAKNEITLHWKIAEGYYLYQKRFKFSIDDNSDIQPTSAQFISTPTIKDDPYFGKTAVFKHDLSMVVPVQVTKPGSFTFTVQFQGCAEKGLCYPPTKVHQTFTASGASAHTSAPTLATETSKNPDASKIPEKEPTKETILSTEPAPQTAQGIAATLEKSNIWVRIAIALALGLGLTFTPCVFPMIPILSSILAGQTPKNRNAKNSTKEGFIFSLIYVLGMSLAFAISGMIVAYTGAKIQLFFQNPIVLSVFALIFVLLAFSMFGFYNLQLPQGLQDYFTRLNQKQQGGTYTGVFVMGVLSALVVSPCVSAPLAGILLLIAKEGDLMQGGLSLFALGFGMGIPLLIIGTTGANILPRAGAWMDSVKAVFGVLLLAIAAWLVRSVLPDVVMMIIWAAFLIIPAIYMGLFEQPADSWQKLWKGVAVLFFAWGLMILIGAGMGKTNPLSPIELPSLISQGQNHSASLHFEKVRTVSALNESLQKAHQSQQAVMVDFYADWCIACIEMEHQVFNQPEVASALNQTKLIQVDITDNPEADALLNQFKLIGPPAILFWNKEGQLLEKATILGAMTKSAFLSHLTQYQN